jgi:hypothetical protein
MAEADDHIRHSPLGDVQAPHSSKQPEVLGMEHGISARTVRARHLSRETIYGGFAGLVMGTLAGEGCFWLSGEAERLASGALIGAGIGSLVGALMGIAHRMIRGPFVRPSIATITGILSGLSPSLIAAIFIQNGNGLLVGGDLVEPLVCGPFLGLFIGALFDRAFDASHGQSWSKALAITTITVAVCGSLGGFMVLKPFGPNPNDLAKTAKSMILSKWREDPKMRNTTIESVTLARKIGAHYTGFFDATIDGWPQRFRLSVSTYGETIGVTWEPADE